jgi:stage II sporulation protein D
MRRALLLTTLALLLVPVAGARASTRWTVRGGGFGHGVGMSQYGAYGYAQHTWTYDAILRHYYQGAQVASASSRKVRVLLGTDRRTVRFRGADRLAGVRDLRPSTTYTARRSGSRVALNAGRKRVGTYRLVRAYRRGGTVRFLGRTMNGVRNSRFHGAFDVRPGLWVINRVGLDDYVKGVVSGEMPSSWAPEALKAQAVAARTYAVATRKVGGVFDLYPDTRSQVYQGVAGETFGTNTAVRATRGRIVTYDGGPIVTYYFSTSGGETENVEYSFFGALPKPYLRAVDDPYDGISPRHRWRFRFSSSRLDARLGAPGRLRKVKVLKRGASPRIVRARVYGTRGSRTLNGAQIRSRLGLYDTWAYFTRVSTSQAASVHFARTSRSYRPRRLEGAFVPAPRGRRIRVELRVGKRWKRVGTVRTSPRGSYRVDVRRAGLYRVRAGSVAGPATRVR